MMKNIVLIVLFGLTFTAFAQEEKEYPLLTNPNILKKKEITAKASGIDSTILYITDTLSLPFFDEFSQHHFQKYLSQIGDPDLVEEKYYLLMDNMLVNPLPLNSKFTTTPTYKVEYDLGAGTSDTTFYTALNIQIADFSAYPVSYSSLNVYPPYYVFDTINPANPIDTSFILDSLVLQDSASIYLKYINDPNAYWLDEYVYHNYHMAKDPWTLGVATFDGVSDDGYPYDFNSNGTGYADVLTSKPINLSNNTIADSIYFSFLWQPQGLCDEPEEEDSLTLQFYNPTTGLWEYIWRTNGSPVKDFRSVHIPITNPDYFADDFQFRFRNHGKLNGALDHFHLDYVHMRAFSAANDTLFKDFAFVYPIGSLLKEYSSVPWDHYKASSTNHMSNQVEISVRNGSDQTENNPNGSVVISHVGNTESTKVLVGQDLANGAINYAPRTTYFSYHDFSTGYEFDRTKPGTKQVFDLTASANALYTNPVVNDTTRGQQYFGWYYSYDDGTAERAYGPTSNQARLAIEYTPYVAGDLIGAMISFVPSVNDVSNSLFVLTVWGDNNGKPGEVIYEDDLFFPKQPVYEDVPNRFTRYFFQDSAKVPVSGKFYIGWRQFEGLSLNVGLDKNIDRSNHTYYSVDGGNVWNQSSIPGSVMIRPMFSTGMDAELGMSFPEADNVDYSVYPNPSEGEFTITSNVNGKEPIYQVFDLQGKLILSGEGDKVNLTLFKSGIYLLRIEGAAEVLRLVKK